MVLITGHCGAPWPYVILRLIDGSTGNTWYYNNTTAGTVTTNQMRGSFAHSNTAGGINVALYCFP